MKDGVSQQLFDDVVKENMEEFGMESEEALKDAVSQVTAVKMLVHLRKTGLNV